MLEVDIVTDAPPWRDRLPAAEEICRRAALAAFQTGDPGIGPAEASVVLADSATVRGFNRQYRGRDEPTNVLSFANVSVFEDLELWPQAQPILLGDIVIAFETAVAEAVAEGKDLADHLSHLVVHGMLHLLGYDHRTNAEAARMEGLEVEILARLGVPNPYAPADDRER